MDGEGCPLQLGTLEGAKEGREGKRARTGGLGFGCPDTFSHFMH